MSKMTHLHPILHRMELQRPQLQQLSLIDKNKLENLQPTLHRMESQRLPLQQLSLIDKNKQQIVLL